MMVCYRSANLAQIVIVMLTTGAGLYLLLLTSPETLQGLLKDVIQCGDVPVVLPPVSSDQNPDNLTSSTGRVADAVGTVSDDNALSTPRDQSALAPSNGLQNTSPAAKIRVVVGIFVMAKDDQRRRFLRMVYGTQQSSEDADFTVRFVMGALEGELKAAVEKENATYGDIIVLDCQENMDEGKTFSYFSSLPGMLETSYDYVMKADDDSYIHFGNLGSHLKLLSRTDLYYGYLVPCGSDQAHHGWMAGCGYVISWDLVQWIADSPIPRNRTVGMEDQLVREWFDEGGMAKNRATTLGWFYDYVERIPDYIDESCASPLKPETILVHRLKSAEQWLEVLAFFFDGNGTNSLP